MIYRLPNVALVQKVRELRIEFESVFNSNSYEPLFSILIRIESNLAKVRFDSIRAERYCCRRRGGRAIIHIGACWPGRRGIGESDLTRAWPGMFNSIQFERLN
jgi:hypothetical protein